MTGPRSAEKTVQLMAKLYDCRNAAKTILGDRYKAEMAEYGDIIMQVAGARWRTSSRERRRLPATRL